MTDLAYTNRAEYLQMHRERRELIVAAVKAGQTYLQIANQFGISQARVGQIAKKHGVAPGRRRAKA